MKQHIYLFLFSYFLTINLQAAAAAGGGAGASAGASDTLDWIHPACVPAIRAGAERFIRDELKRLQTGLDRIEGSEAIPMPGVSCPYDCSFEISLREAAALFKEAPETGLKIADIGCGLGGLIALLPYISDGSKPLTIAAVDGIEGNISRLKSMKRPATPEKVEFKVMPKLIQALPTTIYFGPEAHETFDIIFCLNVLHCMSVEEKQNALEYMYKLLKPGGRIVVSHNKMLTSLDGRRLDSGAGVYATRYPLSMQEKGTYGTGVGDFMFPAPKELEKMSPQQYIINLDGKYATYKGLSDIIEAYRTRGSIPSPAGKICDLYRISEIVTVESMEIKLLRAGFEILLKGTHGFNDPKGTDFGRSIAATLYKTFEGASAVEAVHIVGKKPL